MCSLPPEAHQRRACHRQQYFHFFGQCLTVAKLNCELDFRTVNYGLAMEADDINSCRVGFQKTLNPPARANR